MPTTSNTPSYLTMSEYSNKAGISLSQIKRLKLANRLPFIQEGKLVRIPAQALDYEWLSNWRREQGIAS
jgi:excisionase family DNA binding protein